MATLKLQNKPILKHIVFNGEFMEVSIFLQEEAQS